MPYQDKDQKKLRGIFPTDSKVFNKSADKLDSPAVFSTQGQFYAVASEDEIIKKFQLILRSGKKYRVPYALLPIAEISDCSDEISMIAYQLLITIKGRNLEPVEEYLADETLIWVKESPSRKDDGQSAVFISNITIEGKAINKQID